MAKQFRKIKNQNNNFKHTHSKKLIENNDIIVIEDLNLLGMMKRPYPKKDPNRLDRYLPMG